MKDRWLLRARIGVRQFTRDGKAVDFVTITSHEKLTTFAQTEYVWREAWPNLYAALKNKSPELQYYIVPERHKDGRMHVHALWTAGVTQKWLKDAARRRGLGHQAKIIAIESDAKASNYMTKYVGKDLGDDVPEKFRRVRVSRFWPDLPAPVTNASGLEWVHCISNASLEAVYKRCVLDNVTLIDMETGQIFDDVDIDARLEATRLQRTKNA